MKLASGASAQGLRTTVWEECVLTLQIMGILGSPLRLEPNLLAT